MAKVEIEESELATLRQVNTFANTALQNPKTRAKMLGIQKELNPDAVIPELDATENVMKAVRGVEEKVDGMMKALTDRDTQTAEERRTSALQTRMQKGQEDLRAAGYNEDGIKKIEELMLSENIGSYAAGLALFERLNPPASPSDTSRSSRWGASMDENIQGDDYKDLWESQGHSETWLQNSLATVRKDFRN